MRFAAPRCTLQSDALKRCTILVVEDEPLISLDITQALKAAGAEVTTTNALNPALLLVEHADLSAAVVDLGLADGKSDQLCQRLKERGIPFLVYTGFSNLTGPCSEGPRIAKPADPSVIVETIARLVTGIGAS